MMLRPGETAGHGVAVLPFLKTTEQIRLGSFSFRSTEDTAGLSEEDATHVCEIADMLYLVDDFRIRSASYALLPSVDLNKDEPVLQQLERVQAVVAYCYSSPHPTLGVPFLCFEHASLAVFSPEPVSIFMVRPEHHVREPASDPKPTVDQWQRVQGYEGRYNFQYNFWVTKGSRLYPPVPNIGLNLSQDLAHDLGEVFSSAEGQLFANLLLRPPTEAEERLLTAIKWYNRANSLAGDEHRAMADLAVGFEALLGLPKDAKTDRFVDSVSLLLGRIARLGLWAEQFYSARSDVTHEGKTERLYFTPPKTGQAEGQQYHSLLAYGRQIFRLCAATLLFGADLGERAGLKGKLVTNQERFESICKALDDESRTAIDRFAAIEEAVALADRLRFVQETGLSIKTLAGAAQRAAKNLLECDESLAPEYKKLLECLAQAEPSYDSYEALTALAALKASRDAEPTSPGSPGGIARCLIDIVWHYTFMHYYWLKEQRKNAQKSM